MIKLELLNRQGGGNGQGKGIVMKMRSHGGNLSLLSPKVEGEGGEEW